MTENGITVAVEGVKDLVVRFRIEFQRSMLLSDAEVLRAFKPFPDGALKNELDAMARNVGVDPPPQLFFAGEIGVNVTKEGKFYILLDETLSSEMLKAIYSHELGHIVLGHVSPENYGRRTADESIRQEGNADWFAVSQCQGPVLSDYLSELYARATEAARERGYDFAQIEQENLFRTHPLISERINILTEGHDLMGDACAPPEGAPRTPAVSRGDEHGWEL